MSTFRDSTQYSNWLFDSRSLKAALRNANRSGRSIVRSGFLPEKPLTAAGFKLSASGESELGESSLDASDGEDSSQYLSVEEESSLKLWYLSLIGQMCGIDSTNERLRRSEKVDAGAKVLFQRFYLGNSIMAYDPKLIMLASIFLVSKIEDQIICIEELEKATGTREADILAMEIPLLEGIRLHLRVFTPYPPLLGLLDQAEKFILSSGGTFSSSAMLALHTRARKVIDDALMTDLPLLHEPARIALASLVHSLKQTDSPPFDGEAFMDAKFGKAERYLELKTEVHEIQEKFAALIPVSVDLTRLKPMNKKLKKCALWNSDSEGGSERKKKRKVAEQANE